MADQTIDIKINTIVEGAGGENSIAGIRKSIKALKSEALSVGESGKGFKQLTQRANELQDKLDDLKDSAKSLQGTGIEKLKSSFGLLTESFKNADFGKAQTAFKGVGAAMKAVPIFLIIEGIKFLIEAFDKLKNSSGLLGKAFRFIGDIIDTVIRAVTDFTDAIGLTGVAAEKAAAKTIAAAKKQEEAVTASYDAQIEKAEAAGENTLNLEKAKQQAILKTLKIQIDAIIATATANGRYSEEQIKQIEEIGKKAAEVNKDLAVAVAKDTKEKSDASKKAGEDRLKDEQKLLQQIADEQTNAIKDDVERETAKANLEKQRRDKDIEDSKASVATKAAALKASELQLQTELDKIAQTAAEKKKALDDKAKADAKTAADKARAAEVEALTNQAKTLEILQNHSIESRLNTLKVQYDIDLAAAADNASKKLLLEAKYNEDVAKLKKEGADKIAADQKTADEKAKAERDKQVQDTITGINSALESISSIINSVSELNQAKADEALNKNQENLSTQLDDLSKAKDAELAKEGLTADQKVAIENKYKLADYALKVQAYNKETEIKKKAFEQDKKFKIAQTVISTITGAISAVTGMISSIPGPVGIVLGALAGIAVAAAGAAAIAKINATKFDAGTPPAPPTLTVPSSSAGADTAGPMDKPELKRVGRGTNLDDFNTDGTPKSSNEPIRAYVVSQDITTAQNKNAIIERRSSF